MITLKNEFTSEVAGIILNHLREKKGRLTEVSDLCNINRKELNRKGLAKMKMHRLLRLIYAMELVLPYPEYDKMWSEILDKIQEFADNYDCTLLVE
jgi:hypothetical protein